MSKPILIEEYQPREMYPAVKIMLDGGYFRATLQGSPIGSHTLDALKRMIASRIDVLVADLPWTPVIQLTLHHEGVRDESDNNPLAAAVSIRMERYHVAIVDTPKDGVDDSQRDSWSGKIFAPWEKTTPVSKLRASKNWYHYFGSGRGGSYYDAPRAEDGSLKLPTSIHTAGGGRGEHYLLAYTDETWAGLMALVQSIHNIRAQLRAIAGSAELVRALSAVGGQMLEASKLLPGGAVLALPAAPASEKRKKRALTPNVADYIVEPMGDEPTDEEAETTGRTSRKRDIPRMR